MPPVSVRLGLLAASRIADKAILAPLSDPGVPGIELVAVGARDLARAEAAASAAQVGLAFGSYGDLIASDQVDAVYIATPAGLHRPWALAAIEAGKHALVEKPFANNAADARIVAEAAAAHPAVVVMEAFHWRYHPLADRITEVIGSGAIGRVVRAEGAFNVPAGNIPPDDIRFDLALGGGATMDLGCYAIQWVRHAVAACPETGGDPTVVPEVVSADAVVAAPDIDGQLVAELRWPSGAAGSIESSMLFEGPEAETWLVVRGTHGTLEVTNPIAPQSGGAELRLTTSAGTAVEPAAESATYFHQLVAFRDAIVHGTPFPTDAADAVRNMQVIDACYQAAGLGIRPTLL